MTNRRLSDDVSCSFGLLQLPTTRAERSLCVKTPSRRWWSQGRARMPVGLRSAGVVWCRVRG